MIVVPGFIEFSEAEIWAVGLALVLMVLDVIVGFGGAVIRGDVSSTKMREGLGHKAMLVALIAMAMILQTATLHIGDTGWSFPLVAPCCLYIAVMEVASVLENTIEAYPALKDTPIVRIFDREDEEGDK